MVFRVFKNLMWKSTPIVTFYFKSNKKNLKKYLLRYFVEYYTTETEYSACVWNQIYKNRKKKGY